MSVKDIKLYYNEVCDQYHDMLTELRDFEEEAKAILSAFGYEDGDYEICIRRLTDRICECEEIPMK